MKSSRRLSVPKRAIFVGVMKTAHPLHNLTRASIVGLMALAASLGHAATYYWDTSDTAGLQPGSGIWATSGFNLWAPNDDGSGTKTSWINGNDAVFSGTPDGTYTITLGTTPMTVNAMTFNTGGYTLSAASASTITGTGNISIASGKTLTLGENVTIQRTGTGGASNITGFGTVQMDSGSSISTTGSHSLLLSGTNADRTQLYVNAGASVSSVQYLQINGNLFVDGGSVSSGGNGIFIGNAANTNLSSLVVNSGNVTAGSSTGVAFGPASSSANSGGTLQLNGGILTTQRIWERNAAATSVVNFNGGTVRASAASTDFMSVDSAVVQSGGARFDTNGHNVTIAQALTSGGPNDGGLTKLGNGTLTLSAANTYNGVTTVETGTLALAATGSISSSSRIDVRSGATLNVSAVSGFTIGSSQELTGSGTVVGAVAVAGVLAPVSLTLNSSVTFQEGSEFRTTLNSVGDFSSLNANGVTIASGSTFGLVLGGGFSAALDDTFLVLTNSAAGAISGSFANLAEGGTISSGVYTFSASYLGGNGNDLVLTVVAVPEPAAVLVPAFLFGLLVWRGAVIRRRCAGKAA